MAGAGRYLLFDVATVGFWEHAGEEIRHQVGLGTVTVGLQDFEHRASQDEIWVDGKLYDIGSYTVVGNRVVISVYHDSDEEKAIGRLVGVFDGSDVARPNKTEPKIRPVQQLPEPVFPPQSSISIAPVYAPWVGSPTAIRSMGSVLEQLSRVNAPPPKHECS